MGCIPVILRSNAAEDEVYADLPVLLVQDYAEVTEELLLTTLQAFKYRSFNWEKASWPYWSERISEVAELGRA